MVSGPNQFSVALRYQPLLIVFAAFCVGIIVDRFLSLAIVLWLSAAVLAWAIWLLLWRIEFDRWSACVLLTAVAATGGAWHHVRWNFFEIDNLGRFAREESQPVCVEAIALAGPRKSPAPPPDPMNVMPVGELSQVTLWITKVRDGSNWRSASGKVKLNVEGHLLSVHAGDRLRVFGQLNKPRESRNPREFDFQKLLRTRHELCRLRANHPSCIATVSRVLWCHPRRLLQDLRDRCNELLWTNINHERAGLAAAILLGAREQVDRERNEDFFTTGTVHLLAISGLHVGMLAYMFWFVARTGLVPRRWAIVTTIIFVVLYAVLTDARPPVVRATILIVMFCTARLLGRPAFSFNTLAAAGLVVLALNPAQLFQTGTQLSFLAVATLACCAPLLMPRPVLDPLDRLIANTRPLTVKMAKRSGQWIFRLWLTSTCIWLVALPLVLYRFNLVTPIAMGLNPLLMVPIAIALFSGFGVLIFGWFIPPIGWVFGWLCDTSLWFIETSVQTARPMSGSHFFMPAPAGWWVFLFYLGLALFVALPRLRPPRRWCTAIAIAWIPLGLFTMGDSLSPWKQTDQLNCTFIDVGHGTSVVVELPDGKTLLYDAGRLGAPHVASRAVTGFLWSRGITHLDAVIISHADADHYDALPKILDRVSVGTVFISPIMFEDESRALDHLRRSIEEAGVPIRNLWMGDVIRTSSDVQLEVLHPPERGVLGSDNANSIVLQIDYAGRRILLPGDLESPGLEDVLAEPPLDCDVVMAPHHGSIHSNPAGFAAWSTPEWVVISGGHGRDLSAVKQSFRANGAIVVHTAETGAVRVTIDRENIQVRTWRENPW